MHGKWIIVLLFWFNFLWTWCLATEPVSIETKGFQYLKLVTEPENIRIICKDQNDKLVRTFPKAIAYLTAQDEKPEILMSGAIFEPDGQPAGLLIQNGKQLFPLNRKTGKGNFYLQPNGVLLISAHRAIIAPTTQCKQPMLEACTYATQSGPLLLIGGSINPAFDPDSNWQLHRHGVGILENGKLIFLMTDLKMPKRPNLYEFATTFKYFGCKWALFLDGDLCLMRWKKDMLRPSNHFGSVIAVVKTESSLTSP